MRITEEKAFSSYEEDGVKVLSQIAKPQALLTKVLPLREMTEEEKCYSRIKKYRPIDVRKSQLVQISLF